MNNLFLLWVLHIPCGSLLLLSRHPPLLYSTGNNQCTYYRVSWVLSNVDKSAYSQCQVYDRHWDLKSDTKHHILLRHSVNIQRSTWYYWLTVTIHRTTLLLFQTLRGMWSLFRPYHRVQSSLAWINTQIKTFHSYTNEGI